MDEQLLSFNPAGAPSSLVDQHGHLGHRKGMWQTKFGSALILKKLIWPHSRLDWEDSSAFYFQFHPQHQQITSSSLPLPHIRLLPSFFASILASCLSWNFASMAAVAVHFNAMPSTNS
jgi:hypothetical protein